MLVAAIRESLIEAGEGGGLETRPAQPQPPAQNGLSDSMAGGAVASSGGSPPEMTSPSHQVCKFALDVTLLHMQAA